MFLVLIKLPTVVLGQLIHINDSRRNTTVFVPFIPTFWKKWMDQMEGAV